MPDGFVRPDGKLPSRTADPGAVGSSIRHNSSGVVPFHHVERPALRRDAAAGSRDRMGKCPSRTAAPGAVGSSIRHNSSPVLSTT